MQDNHVFVNGPINVARLEGKIFGINKHIYIFMDYHMNVSFQSQCNDIDSIDSIDLNKYIIDQLKNSNKNITYDLFFEIGKMEILEKYTNPYRGRYIDEVARFFLLETNSDKKKLPNVRYHYIDIRDYIKMEITNIYYNIKSIIKKCVTNEIMYNTDYNTIILFIDKLYKATYLIYNLLFPINKSFSKSLEIIKSNNDKTNNKSMPKSLEIIKNKNDKINNLTIIKNFINKIKSQYKHKEIPTILSELFDKIKVDFERILNLLHNTKKLVLDADKFLSINPNSLHMNIVADGEIFGYGPDTIKFLKFIGDLQVNIYDAETLTIYNFALIVDLFFLRRFLDKDYIQKLL